MCADKEVMYKNEECLETATNNWIGPRPPYTSDPRGRPRLIMQCAASRGGGGEGGGEEEGKKRGKGGGR